MNIEYTINESKINNWLEEIETDRKKLFDSVKTNKETDKIKENKILKIPEKSYITIFCITTQCVRGEAIIKVLTNRFGVLYFDVRVPYPAYDPALALKSSHPICTQMPMWVEIFAHYW